MLPVIMNETELSYWLALWHCPGIGPMHFQKFLSQAGSVAEVWQARNQIPKLKQLIKKIDWHYVETALTWQQQPGQKIICLTDANYPSLLKQIADPPALLYVKGQVSVLSQNQLAMVGSRQPTPIGKQLAMVFARQLALHDLVITSGLALGIDSICHQGALACEKATIAVLGNGLFQIYPSCHRLLAEQITRQGALVSELRLDAPPRKLHFPKRNRIVSGLSLGCLIVEASRHSGSLITAALANEQGREVFAIPSTIFNQQAAGCHYLIQHGAKLVTAVADILDELKISNVQTKSTAALADLPNLSHLESKLLSCIDFAPTDFDLIVARVGFDASQAAAICLQLELDGWICKAAGGFCRILK